MPSGVFPIFRRTCKRVQTDVETVPNDFKFNAFCRTCKRVQADAETAPNDFKFKTFRRTCKQVQADVETAQNDFKFPTFSHTCKQAQTAPNNCFTTSAITRAWWPEQLVRTPGTNRAPGLLYAKCRFVEYFLRPAADPLPLRGMIFATRH